MVLIPSRFAGRLSFLAGRPRRIAAVLCLGLAVVSALTSHAPPAGGHTSAVVVAAKPLRPGTVLAATDLAAVLWPAAIVPAAAVPRLSDALGHVVGAAMSRGEPLTAARLLDTGISAALGPGQVALTIGLAGGNQAAILQAGAVVDLYAANSDSALIQGQPPPIASRRLGADVRVLAVLPPSEDGATGSSGPSLVIAVDRGTAARLADHPAGQFVASLVPPS
ncbi:MAG TPA: SAF domain-containing protein [Jatrophihabitans sp.]|jgi:Flp pilus assembly protein CpaB|uniref:SAF domain-containing protein n=1 Tax=Jatrophihabitans sp. TaxID=1932789 RepID=UPI002EF814D3